jgi:hypothetical protein
MADDNRDGSRKRRKMAEGGGASNAVEENRARQKDQGPDGGVGGGAKCPTARSRIKKKRSARHHQAGDKRSYNGSPLSSGTVWAKDV